MPGAYRSRCRRIAAKTWSLRWSATILMSHRAVATGGMMVRWSPVSWQVIEFRVNVGRVSRW